MSLSQSLFTIAVLIAVSAFFSMAEISLTASRRLRLRQMADAVESEATDPDDGPSTSSVPRPTPRIMQWVQTAAGVPLFIFAGLRWAIWLLTASWILRLFPGFEFLPHAPAWLPSAFQNTSR